MALSLIVTAFFSHDIKAQQSVVDAINSYGTFDRWSIREVKESSIIGGATKQLYEFYGNQEITDTRGQRGLFRQAPLAPRSARASLSPETQRKRKPESTEGSYL